MMAYRFNFYTWFLVDSLNIMVISYIWLSIYKQGNTVGNYSLKNLISYFVLSRVISMAIGNRSTSDDVAEDIRQGRLSNYLLKPINYFWSNYFITIGELISNSILTIPLVIITLYFFHSSLVLSIDRIVLFLLSLLVSSALGFCIWYFLGMLTFYMDNIFGPQFMLWLLFSVFSGRTAPLDIMPAVISNIANLLPFKYMLFIPMQIINGSFSIATSINNLLLGFVWILCLYLFSMVFYNFGLKKYESNGS